MKFRNAKQSDKNNVLKFCTNTFEWDDWYSDPNGYLTVAEDSGVIALSHAYICPNRKRVWLEGVRVNPNFRRKNNNTKEEDNNIDRSLSLLLEEAVLTIVNN